MFYNQDKNSLKMFKAKNHTFFCKKKLKSGYYFNFKSNRWLT